jgi:hypothetical protein
MVPRSKEGLITYREDARDSLARQDTLTESISSHRYDDNSQNINIINSYIIYMAIPILFIYAIGIIFFILAIEESDPLKTLLYFGTSFFINSMAYVLSYTNTDYLYLAYLPMILMVFSLILLLKSAWGMIPNLTWDDKAKRDMPER